MAKPKTDKEAIRQTIQALKNADYELDCVLDIEGKINTATETEAMEAIMAVGSAWLRVTHTLQSRSGRVFFVLGNDPEEVICNYTINLEHVIGPLMDSWD